MRTFSEWWNWDLRSRGHAELANGATRCDRGRARAMLEKATEFEPSVVVGRRLNELLAELGEAPLAEQEYKPVRAA
jgi:hypothetical protein